jgi:GH24 family phage-related lysozyme (muramidase)
MNWYNKEKYSSLDWGSVLRTFSLTVLMGAAVYFGLNNIEDLKEKFSQDPQTVMNIIEQSDDHPPEQPRELQPEEPEISPPTDDYIEKTVDMIIKHEGKRNKVYLDTRNIPHIGIGFNLNRSDAKSKIKSLGLNFSDILSGKTLLSDDQIMFLFEQDFNEAIKRANTFLYNSEDYPSEIKSVIIDMAFNLGNDIFEFDGLRKALLNKDYNRASDEMVDSKWYKQVGNRSKDLSNIVKNINGD